MRTPARIATAGVPLLLLLAACGGSDPYAEGGEGGGDPGTLVVGSADFPESTLLGNIYAQALENAGLQVETQFNIGSREVYYDQIESGNLSVFPEYNGAVLAYLDPEAASGATEETNEQVRELLPEGLEILDSSAAQDKDSLTVTRETAEEHDLATVADLEPVAGELVLGGPSEFETRAQGVPGLERTYGLAFESFRSLDSTLVPQALRDGDVQVANLFTTDPAIAANDFVVLEDTENLFGSQNVTPLVYSDAVDDTAREALNAVSAELTTETLTELNRRVSIDHEDPDAVAADWLSSVGLA
ncbi:ABC transporter substrate-binding protein [Marinitenerispora sediminis]|uniref:Glycine/betaine ABC transporter substrate-binding protein n=1 Tax=Marinitenerispora sediminis TaxID=1931232 RepID=A0A368SZW2_9ACTN|nr:ABC transporter substrate-binding protein [Marinitenerispora sediminis]RCV48534.1 glycine/betaine ABC transporter substrate-binding protein [Marinitenerispora sediminis]RCV51783.1 glycine/betaine ABC transporter substrate-binding protein [Marinitenerispora sediminis]RCV57144.1 glycine/betaine ABC transporter substrate-binding protein [Marinitenerispora sediminis]